MKPTIKYIFLTAFRDRLYQALFAVIILTFLFTRFIGEVTLVEQQEANIIFFVNIFRLILVLGMSIFTCLHISRMFENKEIEMMLSKPINPFVFIFSLFIGYWLTSILFILGAFVLLTFSTHNFSALSIWSLSVFFEIGVLLAFALFVAIILKNPIISIIATITFYILGRMIGFFLYFTERQVSIKADVLDFIMHKFIYYISAILPRLDSFSKSSWIISNDFALSEVAIIQALIFIPFVLIMAVFDLKRKEF